MPGIRLPKEALKRLECYEQLSCLCCKLLLDDPVQTKCGHRFCRSCFEVLVTNSHEFKSAAVYICPECHQEFAKHEYFADRSVKREIQNLAIRCLHHADGCYWEGIVSEYATHVEVCRCCREVKIFPYNMEHEQGDLVQAEIPRIKIPATVFKDGLPPSQLHCVSCKLLLKEPVQSTCGHRFCKSCADEIIRQEATPQCPECEEEFEEEDGVQYFPDRFVKREINSLVVICPFSESGCSWEGVFGEYQEHVSRCDFVTTSCEYCAEKVSRSQLESHRQSCPSVPKQCPLTMMGCKTTTFSSEQLKQHMEQAHSEHFVCLMEESLQEEIRENVATDLRQKDNDLDQLRTSLTKLEENIKAKSAEFENRDFRLSLIENSNYDGSMIWKILQFSQRKTDAENGKYTSIFSLPFYSSRYGYKMCLRLYIMGDGIGKGTHLSLFFVVMRGEFDNILQWPFTHKVTFKLINQAGGRDIVDTFQPDPMSSSFRKPRSDMNIASGCPRFVSHTELERGGFIVDDTIFIKCMIDTSTIFHP